MNLLEIFNKVLLLTEGVSQNDINYAIDNRVWINITYDDDSESAEKGKRYVAIYAYGLSMAGNPIFRGYQLYGKSKTLVPTWKTFRLDRVMSWTPTYAQFWSPIEKLGPSGAAPYNPNGDGSMKIVYNQVDFSKKVARVKKPK